MVQRTLEDLARDLADRRRLSEPPPILLLGAGASLESGIGMMGKLYTFVGAKDFDGFVSFIDSRDENERYRLLAEFLQTQDPDKVTPGYTALAELCAAAAFDVVLTTNMDPLLDDALAAARLRRRDYLLFINGVLRSERLALLLRSRSPRVKVVKLHGDLFHRFMAWTPKEMEAYLGEIAPTLGNVLQGRDVLVVGYSLRDAAVRNLAMGLGGTVWYVNPSPPPEEVKAAANVRAVVGKQLTFEAVFTRLHAALGLGAAAAPAPPALDLGPPPGAEPERAFRSVRGAPAAPAPAVQVAETMDDFMAAVVGLARTEDGPSEMTGFLLAEPRVIVTDGWSGNTSRFAKGVVVVTGDGHRYASRLRPSGSGHVFGPALVDAPPELRVPGLRLDATPLAAGTRLQVAVAAGDRVGLSSGEVTTGREQSLQILPIGTVPQMLHIRCAVAPGSSGAPAVDEAMRARGFVVAGSVDPDRPDSFLLQAARWAGALPSPRRRRPRRPAV
jgi:hypothetical protein